MHLSLLFCVSLYLNVSYIYQHNLCLFQCQYAFPSSDYLPVCISGFILPVSMSVRLVFSSSFTPSSFFLPLYDNANVQISGKVKHLTPLIFHITLFRSLFAKRSCSKVRRKKKGSGRLCVLYLKAKTDFLEPIVFRAC